MKKKLVLLLLISLVLIFHNLNVFAVPNKFYEAEYIRGIWITKLKNGTRYYQTARFFRKTDNNEFVYCIEPFASFNENSTYHETINPSNLTHEQKERISLIAHFGYNYKNHTDVKWYAITQLMIWQEADKNSKTYFTDKLDGREINPYQNEINEINNLINNFNTIPSIANKQFDVIENNNYIFSDSNNILNNYNIKNSIQNIKIDNNNLLVDNLTKGVYDLTLERNDINFNKPIIFYEGNNTQNLMETGDINKIISLKLKSDTTQIKIKKIDEDTKSITPSGEASFKDTEFTLYNKDMKKIQTYKLDNNNEISIKNLDFGKYFIKETNAGKGYKTNDKIEEVLIDNNSYDKELTISNKIIEKVIKLNKYFEVDGKFLPEKGIDFEIIDKNGKTVEKIKTDDEGKFYIKLKYGKYILKQKNSTEGYTFSDDTIINVDNTNEETLTLYNYKIKVPDTGSYKRNYLNYIIIFLYMGINNIYVFIKNV